MADEKKKNVLFDKLFRKSRDERVSSDKLAEPNEDIVDSADDSLNTPEWLTDAVADNAQDPDEDISEALAELFGDTATEEAEDAGLFTIPGFEELASAGEENCVECSAENEFDVPSEDEFSNDGFSDKYEYIEENATEDDLDEEEPLSDESSEEIPEDVPSAAQVDEDTATLLAALGYANSNTSAIKAKALSKDSHNNRPADLSLAYGYNGKEYTSRSQTATVKSTYAYDRFKMIVRLGAIALFAIVLCVYDLFGNKFGGALDVTVYPVVNIMISLQILLIAAAFSIKRLIVGINAIFKGEPNVHSISVVALIIALIYDVIIAVAAPETFTLYNFPAAICLFFGALHDYFTLEREICVFDRLSSWQNFVTLERVDSSELAAELGEGGVGASEDTVGQAFRMRKGEFVENYFKRVNRPHPLSKMLAFFLTPAVALAFVMFFVALASDKNFAQAANAFVGVALFTLPSFMLVSMSFPFYMLVTKNLDSNSIIMSEADVAEHRRVDTVVFEESDLFDDTSLTINRISVCDKNQMQDVFGIMCDVSAMYNIIGGKIAGVFRASTVDGDIPSDVEIISVEDGGFEGVAEGKRYCVGSDAYLTSKGISVMRYYDDKYIASNPGGVVLHIAVDGTEVFKLYLTYSISTNVLSVINELSAAKTRIIMRTIDPNINIDLISRILSSSFDGNLTLVRKPFHGTLACEMQRNDGTIDGGIIVNGDVSEAVLDTVRACRLFGAFSKLNFTVGIIVFAIGALFAFLLGIAGAIVDLPSVYLFIFQIVSAIPCAFFASVYLNK